MTITRYSNGDVRSTVTVPGNHGIFWGGPTLAFKSIFLVTAGGQFLVSHDCEPRRWTVIE